MRAIRVSRNRVSRNVRRTRILGSLGLSPCGRAKRRALPDDARGRMDEMIEKCKATVRAKALHPFHDVKNLFGHNKNPYWGKAKSLAKSLAKNTAPLFTLLALANRMIAKRRWFALDAQGASS